MFAENLKTYMERKGFSIADLARKTGVRPNTLSMILAEKIKSPGLDVIKAIGQHTDVSVDFLILDREPAVRGEEAPPSISRHTVAQAVILARSIPGAAGLTPEEEATAISVIAEMLARGWTEEQIRTELGRRLTRSLGELLREGQSQP